MKDIPEHRFTDRQISALMKLLDPHSKLKQSANANAASWIKEELKAIAPQFMQTLVLGQNAPSARQEKKKLDRIVMAAKKLAITSSASGVAPYLKFETGDVLAEDHKLNDLIESVRELERVATRAADRMEKRIERDEKYKRDCAARGLVWSKPDRMAMRVLVQNLARIWHHVNGRPPPDSLTGAFMKFALHVVSTLHGLTTDAQRKAAKNIDSELDVDADSIRSHLRILRKQGRG